LFLLPGQRLSINTDRYSPRLGSFPRECLSLPRFRVADTDILHIAHKSPSRSFFSFRGQNAVICLFLEDVELVDSILEPLFIGDTNLLLPQRDVLILRVFQEVSHTHLLFSDV